MPVYGVLKSSGTNLLITVVRSNVNTGTIAAGYATADDTAIQGWTMLATGGTLTFSNGIAFQTFAVQIISNRFIGGDRPSRFYLTNATPDQRGLPADAPTRRPSPSRTMCPA